MIKVEACISGDYVEEAATNASAAYAGGVDTIELCAGMDEDGLTPSAVSIEAARGSFAKPGLMVMIRPRAGDFHYDSDELALMARQIERASQSGANGVVLGALDGEGNLDMRSLAPLVSLSASLKLATTFHRAFDATRDREAALEQLVGLGVTRILTSGVTWGKSGNALDGAAALNDTIQAAAGRIEVVIAGSISPRLAPLVLREFSPWEGSIAFHSYSGIQDVGKTSAAATRALVESVGRH